MSLEPFIRQAQNNAWANATLYAAVTAMPADGYTAAYPSFFGSIPRTLNHIYEVDLFYIDALTNGGAGRAVFDRDDIMDPAELAAAQAKSDAQLIRHCAGLDEARLHQEIVLAAVRAVRAGSLSRSAAIICSCISSSTRFTTAARSIACSARPGSIRRSWMISFWSSAGSRPRRLIGRVNDEYGTPLSPRLRALSLRETR